jgi:L-asparaginase/Glu-tRNA(Gln) amidotransferase subunit D
MKRIHLLHPGGTLGMTPLRGCLLAGPFLEELVTDVPELRRLAQVDVDILMTVDSSQMAPADWDAIAGHVVACI